MTNSSQLFSSKKNVVKGNSSSLLRGINCGSLAKPNINFEKSDLNKNSSILLSDKYIFENEYNYLINNNVLYTLENEEPLSKLDKKYIYTINSEIILNLFGLESKQITTEGFYLQYIDKQLVIDHLHNVSFYKSSLNNNILNVLNHDNWLTSNFVPLTVKFPMTDYSHSKIPVNEFKLLSPEEKDMLRNTQVFVEDENLVNFCENIANNNDSRFKTKKLIGNYDEAYLYLALNNPLTNQLVVGTGYNSYDIFFINYENNELEFFYITKTMSQDSNLLPLFRGIYWQMPISTSLNGLDLQISDTLPEQFTRHSTLPAIFTSLQFKIVNVDIIQNENIEISFDVNSGWIWRDLTNEPMQMAQHKDGEGHAHIHIGGKKLGRTYNGKYTITREVLNDYINNEFWVPDPLNITISLVNNMHQGYTNQSLDLEEEKIYGIYHYESINL